MPDRDLIPVDEDEIIYPETIDVVTDLSPREKELLKGFRAGTVKGVPIRENETIEDQIIDIEKAVGSFLFQARRAVVVDISDINKIRQLEGIQTVPSEVFVSVGLFGWYKSISIFIVNKWPIPGMEEFLNACFGKIKN